MIKFNVFIWNKGMTQGKTMAMSLNGIKRIIKAAKGNQILEVRHERWPTKRFAFYHNNNCIGLIQFMGV